MKVSILAENLKKGLSICMRGISARVQLPILSTILLKAGKDGLVLSATDLELSFQVKVRAKVIEGGELAVPAKLFSDLVATLPAGVVEFSSLKQTLKITSDKVSAEVVGQGSEEFPSLPGSQGKGMEIPIDELIEKVERVGIAAAKDDSRPILAGVLWVVAKKILTLVATDGYRLGVDVMEKGISGVIQEGEKFVLPVRALMELTRVLEPSMKTVIGQSDQVGESQSNLEAEIEGEEVMIAFNARYLLDYLGAIRGDKVTMETEGELKPAVFRIEKSEFLHVIMPVRTQGA